jgi:hypothetical protein
MEKHMANNRRKGHNYERKIRQELNGLFEGSDWRTTREVSRLLDNSGVDLVDINKKSFFTVQCKSLSKAPNFNAIQFSVDGKPNILFWAKTQKRGKSERFMVQEEYVVMTKETFYKILKECYGKR